jgi:hypothetical protein
MISVLLTASLCLGTCTLVFSFSIVLWIRIYFNADPDPAFYLNADPVSGSQTNSADPDPDMDPGQTLPSQKVEFLQ